MQAKHFAARAGRWSAQHRKTAILGWLVFVVVALVAGSAIGTKQLDGAAQGSGESMQGDLALERAFVQPAHEQVLVRSDGTAKATDPAFRAVVADVATRLERTRDVRAVSTPFDRGAAAGSISKDGRAALIEFDVAGKDEDAADRIAPALAATAAAQRSHDGFTIRQFGDASAEKAFSEAGEEDFARARTLSLPITLAILIVAFGSLVAAGIPVLLAITAVMATLGLVAIPSQIAAMDAAVTEVVLLVGMAVGVDYTLFYMRREREERAAGRSEEAALEAAAATAGRSVLISGLTVMTAMAGMYFTGNSVFSSMATGTIMVVAIAMIGSLTVLPAMLSALGDRVMKARVPFVGRRRAAGESSQLWNAILRPVLRRPALAALASGAVLVALAVPAIGMHTAESGIQGLPQDLEATKALNDIEAAFPGGPAPAHVVVQADDVNSAQVVSAIGRLKDRASRSPLMGSPITVDTNTAGTVSVVSIPLAGSGTDKASNRALDELRGEIVPATIGQLDGVKAPVAGLTAGSRDFNDEMKSSAPLVFFFVLTMAFLLLLVTFRSVVIPATAIVLNLLSVAASYGVLVLVFQHGWFESLLGFTSTGAIVSWLPMFLFVILFGLSMDYHVLVLSRIREARVSGMSTQDAVASGIRASAGVITSAAVVMVAVFGIFATLGALDFKQMGVGLATAILLDATLVRAVLLPATMSLLGERNWYLPRWMSWLPRVDHERSAPTPEPARA